MKLCSSDNHYLHHGATTEKVEPPEKERILGTDEKHIVVQAPA